MCRAFISNSLNLTGLMNTVWIFGVLLKQISWVGVQEFGVKVKIKSNEGKIMNGWVHKDYIIPAMRILYFREVNLLQ